jgi:hypothetical protein
MSLPKPSRTPLSPLDIVRGRPIGMRLPAYSGVERRNIERREALVRRIVAEFDEMPGLRLSLGQASRLLGVTEAIAGRVLGALARSGILHRNASNMYVRRDHG